MIVHVEVGTSFKGAGLYLLHDKREAGEAERLTDARVAWTHALNTLEDDPARVIREMQVTCFNQPMLKMMSGNRIDGRPTEKPVMTVSLSWSLDQQQPTKADMIAAGKRYLEEHGWGELQALMVAHNDTDFKHLHILINRVHPDTGMAADQSFRKHNAVEWARRYDAEQGFFLERREAKYARGEQIEKDMTRAEWEAWKAAGGTRRRAETPEAGSKAGEWDALKAAQQDERRAFFKESATLRAELRDQVRATVKEEFADRWSDYAAHRDALNAQQKLRDRETRRGINHLRRASHGASSDGVRRLEERQARQYSEMKADLTAIRTAITKAQRERIKALAEPALAQLDAEREAAYAALKASHRDEKKELRADQAAGLPRADLAARQQAAAAHLADVSQPRAIPQSEAPTPASSPRYARTRPAAGLSRNEAVRRYHEHGSSPEPRPATPVADPASSDRVAAAAKEVAQPEEGRARRIPRSNAQAFIEASDARADERGNERDSGGGGRRRDR